MGRDELCNVILADARDTRSRRPHVVIGGLGTGKTALLVRMTQLLAERHAVPVAVRLRDAQAELDFRDLARRRFVENIHGALLSGDEKERIWRQLLRDDQIVVLADGLEEALLEEGVRADRDNLIRLAFSRARRERLPLIVASRPHDPLRAMNAAIVQLEPLTEEDALQYIQRGDPDEDLRRLDWIVETADLAETPFYLQITQQLHHARLLEHFLPHREPGQFDTRSVDRAELRFRLLRTWEHALVRGHLPPGVPLGSQDRSATVEQLSVLACIGLQRDRLQVKLDDFDELRKRSESAPEQVPLVGALEQRLKKIGRPLDMRLAATWGMELGLVETQGDSVRFPHSIMQSYLGARLIDSAIADPEYREAALQEPGRELLMALVMRSRDKATQAGPQRVAPHRVRMSGGKESERPVPALLTEAARERKDVKALYLYATALSIDCVVDRPAHSAIADTVKQYWPNITARDHHTLEEAKLNLVRRFGEAVRIIAERRQAEPGLRARPAYVQLFQIASSDPTYSVRLAAAQEIGAGGDVAFEALNMFSAHLRREQIAGSGKLLVAAMGEARVAAAGKGVAVVGGKTVAVIGTPLRRALRSALWQATRVRFRRALWPAPGETRLARAWATLPVRVWTTRPASAWATRLVPAPATPTATPGPGSFATTRTSCECGSRRCWSGPLPDARLRPGGTWRAGWTTSVTLRSRKGRKGLVCRLRQDWRWGSSRQPTGGGSTRTRRKRPGLT